MRIETVTARLRREWQAIEWLDRDGYEAAQAAYDSHANARLRRRRQPGARVLNRWARLRGIAAVFESANPRLFRHHHPLLIAVDGGTRGMPCRVTVHRSEYEGKPRHVLDASVPTRADAGRLITALLAVLS